MANIEELVRHPGILRLFSQRVKLYRDGKGYSAQCPWHEDRTPSLKINERDGKLLWNCFTCNVGGSVIGFLEKFDKISTSEAVKKIKEFIGNSWDAAKEKVESTFIPVAEHKKEFVTYSTEEYAPLEVALEKSEVAKLWLKAERGIDCETAKRLHLGFRQSVGKMGEGLSQDIIDGGWIVFPCIRENRITSIKYRSIQKKNFVRRPGMATEIFNFEAIDPLETIYICEGEIDVLTFEQCGFRAIGLPSSSFKLSPEMKDEIKTADAVILAGDSDQPGQEAMTRLWAELGERSYLLHWPDGLKDANEVFLKKCNCDISAFRTLVDDLTLVAKSVPMANVYSLQESMLTSSLTNLAEHPNRLRFPWKSVDRMAVLLPGSVMSISATSTKTGKTSFVMQITVEAAKLGEVVLNYSCELSVQEYSNMVAAYVTKTNRNNLTREDYQRASTMLGDIKYYIGRNPTLTTVTPVLDLIEAGIRRLGATVVVLDHLHFICRNEENEVQAQANAYQRIKNMAVKYGVKFIVVGQPRKSNQQNKGKVIHISDLKGSESFGSDADAIFVIHRDFVRAKDESTKDSYDPVTEVHLLGARSRGEGNAFAKLLFIGELATFSEISHDEPPPQENWQDRESES